VASEGTEGHDGRARTAVAALLRAGLAAGSLLMVVGIVLAIAKGRLASHPVPVRRIWPWMWSGRPSGFMAAGILVLVATPFLRILALVVAFVLERDWRFVAVALSVAGILALGLALGRA
jgi:uncharacterized membrane protein